MQGDFIEQVILPVTHDLGGFKVHRTLPAKERTMVGPFLFFDQMGPAQLGAAHGIDVRPHPHINLSTVTYLFDGAIEHRDSLGTDIRIDPGAVNLMTAGHGIVHSERSPDDERAAGPALSGIQTWLALPDAAPRLVELRQLAPRTHSAGQARMDGRRLRARTGRRKGMDPDPRRSADRKLSLRSPT